MTITGAIKQHSDRLSQKGIGYPWLETEILAAFTLGRSREWVIAHNERKLSAKQLKKFASIVTRRAKREPLAYIIGKKEFYGREFLVNKNVLIPRPETETLIEETLKVLQILPPSQRGVGSRRGLTIVDIGTGSGCIAITLAKELNDIKTHEHENINARKQKLMIPKIFGIDSSPSALAVARKNAKNHHAEIKFLRGNLLDHFVTAVPQSGLWNCGDLVVVANLPYLTLREWQKTQPEIKKHEPRGALVGGRDGLKYYRTLLRQLSAYKFDMTYRTNRTYKIVCLFEINPWQGQPLTRMINKIFPNAQVEFIKDLGKSVRICKFEINS